MHSYIHKVHYYETDKMGIVHHSNYIRWMEEARMDYLTKSGFSMHEFERLGVTCPVMSLECQYKHSSTYDDEIKIDVFVEEYTGVRFVTGYVMTNIGSGEIVLTAKSTQCFLDTSGIPVVIKKRAPKLDEIMREQLTL